MAPTLQPGEYLWAVKVRWRTPRTGDIVVLRNTSQLGMPVLVKRVVATAGESSPFDGHEVEPGLLVIAGDAPVSLGSRELGDIPCGAVLGSVRGHR